MKRQLMILLMVGCLLMLVSPAAADTMPSARSTNIASNAFEATLIAPDGTIMVQGDSGSESESIAAYRTILKPALGADGTYINTAYAFDQNMPGLLAFDDPQWSAWQPAPSGDGQFAIALPGLAATEPDPNNPGQERTIYYVCAFQVMNSAGAVSIARQYNQDAINFRVSSGMAPVMFVRHPLLGDVAGAGSLQFNHDLMAGIDGEFRWSADAASYGGQVESYRWGWDVLDADDPADPGWDGPAGLDDASMRSGEIPFASGVHTLTVVARDDVGGVTKVIFVLNFVPMPDPSMQLPVLLVDDVKDRFSNAWPGEDGTPLDRDQYRDDFWLSVLDGAGGVAGFSAARDVIDTEDQNLELRDIVDYRSVVWTGKWVSAPNGVIAGQFRPESMGEQLGDRMQYVWLAAYQENGGNLLLAGSRAANAFLPENPYVMPVVFDSAEGDAAGWGYAGDLYTPARVGFGNDAYGDPVYPNLYPYRNLGIAALDLTSPSAAYYKVDGQLIRNIRKKPCAATKGLALDDAFVQADMGGMAAFADTIWTESAIDWNDDAMPASGEVLAYNYLWGDDEFYDADISERGLPIDAQDCEGEACVQPLLRMVSRFDWIQQERQAADPSDTWPIGYYGPGEEALADYCGQDGLSADRMDARTDGQVTAFVSRKFVDAKPGGKGDVVMGFDPYRFDHQSMKDALRWVLGDHFGLGMNP